MKGNRFVLLVFWSRNSIDLFYWDSGHEIISICFIGNLGTKFYRFVLLGFWERNSIDFFLFGFWARNSIDLFYWDSGQDIPALPAPWTQRVLMATMLWSKKQPDEFIAEVNQ